MQEAYPGEGVMVNSGPFDGTPSKEGVRRVTSLPADNFGLVDRGRVVEGAFADIVAFDAENYVDHATFAEPHRYATGVRHVVVNGRVVVADGELTKETPGRRLRRGQ